MARSQLLTAIDLHLLHRDPVSVHTLAGVAAEIIETLCRAEGLGAFLDHTHASFPTKSLKDIWAIRNLYRNAFKHAERDDADVIAQFDEEVNDFLIYVAVDDYLRLRRRSPIVMQVFQVWFIAVHEERLAGDIDPGPFRLAFPGIQTMDRRQQKRVALQVLAEQEHDAGLLRHPHTEPMSLTEAQST